MSVKYFRYEQHIRDRWDNTVFILRRIILLTYLMSACRLGGYNMYFMASPLVCGDVFLFMEVLKNGQDNFSQVEK